VQSANAIARGFTEGYAAENYGYLIHIILIIVLCGLTDRVSKFEFVSKIHLAASLKPDPDRSYAPSANISIS
jgi:hypothetical protein